MSRIVLLPHVEFDAEVLARHLAAGDRLVPLTVEAALRADAVGAPTADLGELVPYPEICALAARAHALVAAQGQPPSGAAVFDGVDWNLLLREDGNLFYARELLLGIALGRALAARGAGEVAWVGPASYPPHQPLHGLLAGLRGEVTAPLTFLTDTTPRLPGLLPRLGARARRLADRFSRRPAPPSEHQRCRIVAVFATSEWRRFTEPLAAIREANGDDFEFWTLGPLTGDVAAWAHDRRIVARSIAYPTTLDADVRRFSTARWQAWQQLDRHRLAADFACPALAGAAVEPRFAQLFTYTLPHTVQWARTLAAELAGRRPGLLLGSAAFNYLSAFPYHVAVARSLPSLALAHTAIPGDHTPLAASHLACRNGFERENFRRAFPADDRVVLARDVANALSYAAAPSPARTTAGKVVAILTSSPSTEGLVLPIVDVAEFVATLGALCAPPVDLGGLRLVFKFHPRYDPSSLAPDLFAQPGVELFSAQAPVTDLLADAWAIVVCNHYGSVVAAAAATGKPLLFLDSARFYYPGVETLAHAAGQVVASPAQLWRSLRELIASPETYRRLADRCQTFRARFLAPTPDSIVDVVAQLASGPVPIAT